MTNRLKDKVAVISGAASGIGAACARRFAAEGACLVANDVSEAACASLGRELGEAGAKFIVATGDVTSRVDTGSIAKEARDFDISVFSAIANYLVLRSTDADAKFLVRNVSNSRQERVLIDRLKQMDRFKAIYFAEGKGRPSQVALSP